MLRARHYPAAALAVAVLLLVLSSQSHARRTSGVTEPVPHIATHATEQTAAAELGLSPRVFATAASETTVLHAANFDSGLNCAAQGWTEVDRTSQLADFFHVDDYAGLSFGPVRGSKSLWCGARATAALCSYGTLPGYGNSWDQAFCTTPCLVYTGTVAVDYLLRMDTEEGYDETTVEYTTDCAGPDNWLPFVTPFSGMSNGLRHHTLAAPVSATKIRIRFQSDGAWSDEDGLYPTSGALHIDSLSVRDASGLRIAVEDFEDEVVGATASNDWQSCNPPPYGSYAFLARGSSVLQQDPCTRNPSCLWAFFENSTTNYACGGFPSQATLPGGNARGQYLNNEIWSPPIPLAGTGNNVQLLYDVYRELQLEDLIFYGSYVRSQVDGCWGPWMGSNFIYWGYFKDWFTHVTPVGGFLDLDNASHVQVALWVRDLCPQWCGMFGAIVPCHSQSPLFDNVRLLRIDDNGPRWTIRDIDQFQDNFAENGTIAGVVRADMANDILPVSNPGILPGDSAVVQVTDPAVGIANDGALGGKKIYGYVAVWPQGQPTKSGANLSGGARWPFAGTQVIGGVTWTLLRLDQCVLNGNPVADTYCLDLNDALFTPGDTVCFFYGAESTNGVKTYAFGSALDGQGDDVAIAAANASEFTCLPAGGFNRGGAILYVDGMDGRGAQPYWDTAWQAIHLLTRVDRYDVRGPTSGVNNRLDGRVTNVLTQLVGVYQGILWDCGDLSITLGDGSGMPEKTDDYGLVNTFLDNLELGQNLVYICGDDVFQALNAYSGASAVTFRTTYLTHSLTSGNHSALFGVSPIGTGMPDIVFAGDTFVIHGGCPLLNDFDVVAPTGSTSMMMTYGPPAGTNGAVLMKVTSNANAVNVKAMMSGFAFEYIRDDEHNGVMDRADHLRDIMAFVNSMPAPTGTDPVAKNSLSQNYPNPFNPTTSIAFSLKERGAASLEIYDVSGRLVRTLAAEELPAGSHVKVWDGRDNAGVPAASGVYFYKLVAPGFSQTKKMVLLK